MSGSPLIFKDEYGKPWYLGYLLGGPAVTPHYIFSMLTYAISLLQVFIIYKDEETFIKEINYLINCLNKIDSDIIELDQTINQCPS